MLTISCEKVNMARKKITLPGFTGLITAQKMKGLQKRAILLILLLSTFFWPAMAGATMYAYLDAKGVCHYKNVKEVSTKGRYTIFSRKLSKPASRTSLAQGYDIHRADPQSLDRYIQTAAINHQVDPLLIKAVIKAESNFDPKAVSAKGAQGLMQLMPATARELQVADPFDPLDNIVGGTKYLRSLLDSYDGDMTLSLAAYNAGPGNVKNAIPNIPETRIYVAKVLDAYQSFRAYK